MKVEYTIMSRVSAETEQKRKAALPATGRCPLCDLGPCMKECVCYCPPYIHNCDDKFHVYDGYCGNGMFQDRPELQV